RSDRLLLAQPAEPGSLTSVMRRPRCGSLRFYLTYVNRNAILVNGTQASRAGCVSVRPDRLPWGSRGKTGWGMPPRGSQPLSSHSTFGSINVPAALPCLRRTPRRARRRGADARNQLPSDRKPTALNTDLPKKEFRRVRHGGANRVQSA